MPPAGGSACPRRPAALDAGLPELERGKSRDPAEALEVLRRIREEMRASCGVYQGDLVAEVRAERERQRDRVLWPDLVPDEDRVPSS
jgi:hypothetical protein